jgi:hypothetical protein
MNLVQRKGRVAYWGLVLARLIVAALWLKLAGCASSGAAPATGSGGSDATGGAMAGKAGTGGASGGTGDGTGGTGVGTGGSGGSAGSVGGTTGTGGAAIDGGADASSTAGVCPGDKSPNPDVATSCTPTAAKAGAACTQDCCTGCGIDLLGQATCTCSNHKYASCSCPLPATWTALGGECGDSACFTEGGPCSPQGYASAAGAPKGATVLEGQPCVMNGNVCFTAESDGKHGCVCASDPSGDFVLRCGLVEGWFSNNGMQTTY